MIIGNILYVLISHIKYEQLNHPSTQDLQRQMTIDMSRACILINEMYWDPKDPNLLLGNVETTATSLGKDLAGLIVENGMQVSFSMRGVGTVKNNNGYATVDRGLRIVTYDTVHYPSHKAAYMRNIINEELTKEPELIDPMLAIHKKELTEYVASASKNVEIFNEQVLNIVKDALEFDLDEEYNIIFKDRNTKKIKGIALIETELHKDINNALKNIFF